LLKQLGVTESSIEAMNSIEENRGDFTDKERIAIRFAEVMTQNPKKVDNSLWNELRSHYDEGEIIELASVIGLFNYFNRFNEALQVDITR
jgi:alkylhydroperoxidase family enzyme